MRAELEAAALTFVFRALFLLYAESAGYLPMENHTYEQRSFTRIAARAAAELDSADPRSTSLWRDIGSLVEAMRTGQTAWGVPPYNGALFSADGFAGADVLEVAAIPDSALAPALVALARDHENPEEVGVDFSGLEIGHLGHIYEGLLSLRLSVADRDYSYDAKKDRYVPEDEGPEVPAGELLWLTNEGGRKGGGVYYTRSELVRHLVRRAVRPAFKDHLDRVRELAGDDPAAAAEKVFEFSVIDPACGSAHFLVEVVEELADQLATLLGDLALPALRKEIDSLRAAAGKAKGIRVEDTALLKRLVLKRCVYGVDLSPMGAEIAKLSLWLGAFVPGLSLAYLDHNIRVGNSLIGVARPEAIEPPGGNADQIVLFGEELDDAIAGAGKKAAALREIDDRTPEEVEASQAAEEELREEVAGAKRVLDLWTAEPLGLEGAREEAELRGEEIIAGAETKLTAKAVERTYEDATFPDGTPVRFPAPTLRTHRYDLDAAHPGLFEAIADEIDALTMARYRPSAFDLTASEESAEVQLAGLLKSGLLKRFESCWRACLETVERMLAAHDAFLAAWEQGEVLSRDQLRAAVSEEVDEAGLAAWVREQLEEDGGRKVEEFDPEFGPAVKADRDRLETIRAELTELGEGAQAVISYDMPWNPQRVVQRNGRVIRLRSPHSEVFLTTMLPAPGELERLLRLEAMIQGKIKAASGVYGMESEAIEGLEAELHSFAGRLVEGDPELAREAEEESGAFVGEELRRLIDRAIAEGEVERVRNLPWGVGACFRQTPGGRSRGPAGVFFATRTRPMADAELGYRYWRYVELDGEELVKGDLEILRRIDPSGGEPEEPMEIDLDAAWMRAAESIVAEHNERADLRTRQEQIGPRQRWALELLRDPNVATAAGADKLDAADAALSVERSSSVRRALGEVRERLDASRLSRDAAADAIVQVVDDFGLRAVDPAPLPEKVESDQLGVVCWMVVLPPRQ